MRRVYGWGSAIALVLLSGALAHPQPAAAGSVRMAPLDPARLGARPVPAIRDRVFPAGSRGLADPRPRVPPGAFEGRFPVDDRYSVRLVLSALYHPDPGVLQSVASFLGGLVHGGEIAGVTVFLATPDELALVCGAGAEACFSPQDNFMVVPAAVPPSGIPREDILAHEYGHALANGRSNFPFPAVTFGTKRWATYERVCPRFLRELISPEPHIRYRDLPGEAFADSYRLLNGGNPGLWVFNRIYFPNAKDFRLIRQDALDPWRPRPPIVLRGTFPRGTRSGATRTLRVSTPLDGLLRVRVDEPPKSDYDVEIRAAPIRPSLRDAADAAALGPALRGPAAAAQRRPPDQDAAQLLICGQRTARIVVTNKDGSGRFSVTVSRPT